MATGGIRAGKAFVEAFLKDNVSKGLDKIANKLKQTGANVAKFGGMLTGAGTAMAAPLAGAAMLFAKMGDEINKASGRTGIAVKELSAIKYAAEQSGTSLEAYEKSVQRMNRVVYDAAQGSKEASDSLEALGISASDLEGLSPDKQFALIADQLAKVDDAGTKSAIAMEVFGRSGTELLPMIANGAAGMLELQQRAEELGLTFDEDAANSATLFGDLLADVWAQAKMVVFHFGSAIADALIPFLHTATRVMATVINWVKENKKLILIVGGVALGLVAAGTAFVALGGAISLVGIAISGFVSLIGVIGSIIGALMSPIGLLVAALVGIGAYLVYTTDIGTEAMTYLGQKFEELAGIAKDVFGGISDALAAGDILLAAKILWTGLKLAWMTGTQELQNKWIEFRATFVQVAGAAFYGALEIWTKVKAALMTAFENTVAFLGNLWDGFIGTFSDLWGAAVLMVKKGLNLIKGWWDDSFDSDAANAAAEAAYETDRHERRKREMELSDTREKERKQAVEQIANDREAAVNDINNREMALSASATENAEKEKKQLEQDKKDLEKQLQDQRQEAKDKREVADAKKPTLIPPDLKKKMDGLDGQAKAVPTVQGSSQGTFNAAAIRGLSDGFSFDKRIAKATEDAAALLRRIEKKDGLKFA